MQLAMLSPARQQRFPLRDYVIGINKLPVHRSYLHLYQALCHVNGSCEDMLMDVYLPLVLHILLRCLFSLINWLIKLTKQTRLLLFQYADISLF